MAGTFSPQVPGSNIDLSRNSGTVHLPRTRASFYGKPLTKTNNVFAFGDFKSSPELALAEGPSCIFVGPIETASKDMLEALYDQARDSYYSGKPLIVDDMFDKVELKLRWYGSKSVVKYPRCSLRRQSTYADAVFQYELGFYLWRDAGQEDPSQVLALASIWVLLLAFGSLAFFIPTIHAMNQAHQGAGSFGFSSYGIGSPFEFLATVNGILLTGLGSLIGFPIASASVQALDGLWRNNLVALKGSCPNCGEEVFAFVRAEEPNQPPHKADCHVCECSLEFRTKVEKSMSRPGRRWVYGRIYVV